MHHGVAAAFLVSDKALLANLTEISTFQVQFAFPNSWT